MRVWGKNKETGNELMAYACDGCGLTVSTELVGNGVPDTWYEGNFGNMFCEDCKPVEDCYEVSCD